MENAADALKIAASVLVFILALTISINALSEVRQVSEILIRYNDREYETEYIDNNNGSTERIVGVETIIPSIYKAYTENYKIVFIFENEDDCLYIKNQGTGREEKVSYIDLEREVLGNDKQKIQFLEFLLYGERTENSEEDKKFNENIKNLGITLQNGGLYGKIKEKSFEEKLGVYYQDDIENAKAGGTNNDSTPEANKIKKRVITYIEQ